MNNNEELIKVLACYSRASIIKAIWGEVALKNINKYRQLIHRRLTNKVEFTELEREKIVLFLKEQNKLITNFLK